MLKIGSMLPIKKKYFYYFYEHLMSVQSHHIFTVVLIVLSLSGCRGSSVRSVPDAPPPYPSYPVPQERYNSAQVYGAQPNNFEYVPPYSGSSSIEQPFAGQYNPPVAPPPSAFPVNRESSYKARKSLYSPRNQSQQNTQNAFRFRLEAKADLWALVQDAKGVELQWLKMKAGEVANLQQSGALTITCSSGDQLIIQDKDGKSINTNPNSSGISIVRLPAD